MNEVFYPVRVFYEKKGRMKFISHLDMNRCISRVLKRTRLPIWYTLGFHPHLYLTFALPLSLGFEGDCESFDFRLTKPVPPQVVKDAINAILPPGLLVQDVALPVMKPESIAYGIYEVTLACSEPEKMRDDFLAFCAQPEILAQKHSKKGLKTIDMRPHFAVSECVTDHHELRFTLKTSASPSMNLNPQLLLKAFRDDNLLWRVRRTQILNHEGEAFK